MLTMENAYIYTLCIFFIMVIFFTYIFNKHEHKGKLERSEFFRVVLVAPFLIAISFFIGRFFEGNSLKFILTLGPGALLCLYLEIEPNSFKKYDPIVKKYGGLFMAVFLSFLITGCSTTPTQKQNSTEIDQQTKDKMMKQFEPPTEIEKGRGSGVIR